MTIMPSQAPTKAFERYREIIPNYEDFWNAIAQPPPVHVRVNTLKIGREVFQQLMAERGYRIEPIPGVEEAFLFQNREAPGSTLEYLLGYYHVQGLTSMLPSKLLDPQPGETILDLCAAPGGKATHMAQLMRDRGLLVANDKSRDRIGILRSHIVRLGTTSVLTSMYHGQNFPARLRFHRILLDPPCSAEGTYRIGRRPPLSENPRVISRLSQLQRTLLDRALGLLYPGGILVYSTCTYAPEENEMVLDEVLQDGRAELLASSIALPHSPGLIYWEDRNFHPDLEKAIRIYPHQVNSWGFFIARLRRLG